MEAQSSVVATKVGIFPVVVMPDGTRQYLIYQPKNKNPLDEVQPFQLARGTPEPEDGGDALRTAMREATEELAIYPEEVRHWQDAGVFVYKDYGIHFFIAHMDVAVVRQPEDALATRWVGVDELEQMTKSRQFKSSYTAIFEQLVCLLAA